MNQYIFNISIQNNANKSDKRQCHDKKTSLD